MNNHSEIQLDRVWFQLVHQLKYILATAAPWFSKESQESRKTSWVPDFVKWVQSHSKCKMIQCQHWEFNIKKLYARQCLTECLTQGNGIWICQWQSSIFKSKAPICHLPSESKTLMTWCYHTAFTLHSTSFHKKLARSSPFQLPVLLQMLLEAHKTGYWYPLATSSHLTFMYRLTLKPEGNQVMTSSLW